jgi:hypothetical protein
VWVLEARCEECSRRRSPCFLLRPLADSPHTFPHTPSPASMLVATRYPSLTPSPSTASPPRRVSSRVSGPTRAKRQFGVYA